MTHPDPSPGTSTEGGARASAEAVAEAARWCARFAAVVTDAAEGVGRIAALIAADWPDDRGREWAERAGLVHRELVRESHAVEELARRVAADPRPTTDQLPVLPSLPGAAAAGGRGARRGGQLGSTDAVRVDDERGMRIAQLQDPPG